MAPGAVAAESGAPDTDSAGIEAGEGFDATPETSLDAEQEVGTTSDGGDVRQVDGAGEVDATDADDRRIDAGPDAKDGAGIGQQGLIHRYAFAGTGTTVVDSVRGANGHIEGTATLDGSGMLLFPQGNVTSYVNLPNGLLSALDEATILVWFTSDVGPAYERVFDFGSSSAGEDAQAGGTTYLALSPAYGGSGLAVAFRPVTGLTGEIVLGTGTPLPFNTSAFVAVTVTKTDVVTLYLNGAGVGSVSGFHLATLIDNNVWLGRSQNQNDHAFEGSYDELRIYDRALRACEIASAFTLGPNDTRIACP
jgi:hypothetical protein